MRFWQVALVLLVAFGLLVVGVVTDAIDRPVRSRISAEHGSGERPQYTGSAPNVVVILVDDMPEGVLDAMPIVRSRIRDKGILFKNGIVPTSLCCPSRASLFTGNYAHTTRVYTNEAKFGSWRVFHNRGAEMSTLATHLDAAGYYTGLLGKYLNRFEARSPAGFIPPGWDKWASFNPDDGGADTAYYDYKFRGNFVSESKHYGADRKDYSTDVLAHLSRRFILNAPADKPLYLHLAPAGTHCPIKPAPRDLHTWPREPRSAIPALNERNISDKPAWVRRQGKVDGMVQRRRLTRIHETAMSLDDATGKIMNALAATGRLDNTILVFMSDNGLLLGSHRLIGKDVPYTAATDVPMLMRIPGTTAPSVLQRITPQLDLTATIANLTGVKPGWEMEGKDIFADTRTGTVLEQGRSSKHPAYCGWRTARFVYVEWDAGGGREFYNYRRDREELHNVVGRSRYHDRVALMRAKAQAACAPVPHGFNWTS